MMFHLRFWIQANAKLPGGNSQLDNAYDVTGPGASRAMPLNTGAFSTGARSCKTSAALFVVLLLPVICLIAGMLGETEHINCCLCTTKNLFSRVRCISHPLFVSTKNVLWIFFLILSLSTLFDTGLANNEVKMSVPKIWTLSCGKYHVGSNYTNSVYTGNNGSSLLAVSMPRDGGDIMAGPYITQIFDDRLDLAEETKVRASVLRGEEGGGGMAVGDGRGTAGQGMFELITVTVLFSPILVTLLSILNHPSSTH